MRLVKARNDCKCKRGCDIRSGDSYYPQRRKKKLCFDCGYKSVTTNPLLINCWSG